MDIIIIQVTHSDMNNAQKVTDHLFNERLIASVHYYPVHSQYLWKWGIEKSEEIITMYKTKDTNRDIVKEAIKRVHPYPVPCILKIPVEANHGYAYRVVENVA